MSLATLTSLAVSEKQARSMVASRHHRTTIWEGAVRSGKTFASCLSLFESVANAPTSGLIAVTGKTLQSIERNVLDPMVDPKNYGTFSAHVQHTPGSSTATIFGRTVHLIGFNDARAEEKIRGATLSLAYMDEVSLAPHGFWAQLNSRLSVEGAKLLATTNPGAPTHFLKKYVLDPLPPALDVSAWKFVMEDNPGLPEREKAAIKAANVGLFYRRNIRGEWVAAEGAIYDSWDPATHVVPWIGLPRITRYVGVGVDYGTTNPTVAILLGLGADGCWYAVDEWAHVPATTGRKSTDAELSAGLRAWIPEPHTPEAGPGTLGKVYVDPAAASFREQLKRDGLPTIAAANDVVPGIQRIASLLAAGRLKVSDRCKTLISEFPGYVWDTKATDKGEDKPVKLNDHALDGLRYVVAATKNITVKEAA